MNITSGIIPKAQKIVLYGPEGIGKSTLASRFPNPLFIDTEGSTARLDVRRMDRPESFAMLTAQAKYVADNPQVCRTLIIDTADWAERLCRDAVCARAKKGGIEDFGFGKGYVYLAEEFGKLLNLLTETSDKGIHVVLTAHAYMRKFELPEEAGQYDRWEMKLGKKTAPLVKEWADAVLFLNYKTLTVRTDSGAVKAQGGSRVIYTSHHPCWDGKNRHNLPEEMPLADWQALLTALLGNSPNEAPQIAQPPVQSMPSLTPAEDFRVDAEKAQPAIEPVATDDGDELHLDPRIPQRLQSLMVAGHVTEEEIRWAVSQKGYFPEDMPVADYPPDFVEGVLIGAWDKVFDMIAQENPII